MQPKSKMKSSFLIIGVCTILLLCGFLWWHLWKKGPETIITNHLEALHNNDISEAYSFTARKFQSAVSLSDFRELLKANSVLTSHIEMQVLPVEFKKNEAIITTILTRPDNGKTFLKYILTKEDDAWKILKIEIDNTATVNFASSGNSTEWLHLIDTQLNALRSKDIEQAYSRGTSRGFRSFSSLEGFKQFVDFNAILSSHKSYVLEKQVFRGSNIIVGIILDPDHEAIPITYILGKEDGQWKIFNLDMTVANLPKFQELLKDNKAQVPIEKQLAALKDRNFLQAYRDPTCQAFRKDVSFELFQELMHHYPIFIDYQSIEFKTPRLENGICFLIVELKGKNDSMLTVEYTLALEDNQWRIWTFRGLPVES